MRAGAGHGEGGGGRCSSGGQGMGRRIAANNAAYRPVNPVTECHEQSKELSFLASHLQNPPTPGADRFVHAHMHANAHRAKSFWHPQLRKGEGSRVVKGKGVLLPFRGVQTKLKGHTQPCPASTKSMRNEGSYCTTRGHTKKSDTPTPQWRWCGTDKG